MKSYDEQSDAAVPPVLLVEDNRINQMVAIQLLKRAGVGADTANNAEEALRRLSTHEYRLVLMDVQMPGMTGIEATQIIRNPDSDVRDHAVPIIAMTAFSSEQDRIACMSAGMNEFLTKPLQIDRFVEVVQRFLPVAPSTADGDLSPSVSAGAHAGASAGAAEGERGALPVIDHRDLLLRSGSDEAVARDLLRRFFERLHNAGEPIAAAVIAGDLDALARHTHGLCGAAGNIGARRLYTVLKQMHAFARDGDLAAAALLLPDLEVEISAVRTVLR
ncbi:MAG: response regulator [Spirochaetaceae bacterium]|nr:MAG: response regulator [Spirochaetaceae bacterium]